MIARHDEMRDRKREKQERERERRSLVLEKE